MAALRRIGRHVPYGVAVLARIGGRYEPYWPRFAVRRVVVLARSGGRYEP